MLIKCLDKFFNESSFQHFLLPVLTLLDVIWRCRSSVKFRDADVNLQGMMRTVHSRLIVYPGVLSTHSYWSSSGCGTGLSNVLLQFFFSTRHIDHVPFMLLCRCYRLPHLLLWDVATSSWACIVLNSISLPTALNFGAGRC